MTIDQLKKLFPNAGPSTIARMAGTPLSVQQAHSSAPAPAAPEPIHAAVAIRPTTDESKLNKTERAFLQYLHIERRQWVGVQNVTLKLGDDCRYTPDFVVVESGLLVAYEVKGFWRDDAKVKIKVAARLFPWMVFYVAVKTKTGWDITPVNP